MEFFHHIDLQITAADIQKAVCFDKLDKVMPSMFVIEKIGENVLAGTIWGEFMVSLDKITGGVRMSLLDCPNALAWTITTGYPPIRKQITIHVTINRTRKSEEFTQEIQEFIEDWRTGISSFLDQ